MANKFNFGQVKSKLEETKRVLAVSLAKQAETHFTDSFKKSALDEYKWDESKRRIAGEQSYMRKPRGISMQRWHSNPTLVGVTGNLRRKVSRSISSATWALIKLVVDLPYAKYLNEGTSRMPPRPFMKQTRGLAEIQLKLIKEKVNMIWK